MSPVPLGTCSVTVVGARRQSVEGERPVAGGARHTLQSAVNRRVEREDDAVGRIGAVVLRVAPCAFRSYPGTRVYMTIVIDPSASGMLSQKQERCSPSFRS
jgi:hypothetical protein